MKKISKKTMLGILALISIISVVFILVKINTPSALSVLSTDPINDEQNVLITKQIDITFNSNISAAAEKEISIALTPQTDFDYLWTKNILQITPKESLQNSTKYSVGVSYQNKEINSFSFETVALTPSGSLNKVTTQSQDDYLYGQTLTTLVNKYPFYASLPIRTPNYVVYYDFDKNMFAITFLIAVEGPDQKTQLINDALGKIKEIGAKDPIKYYTRP